MSDVGVAARSVSEEFSSGCEARSGSAGGSTGAPADQDHRPDHSKQHRDRTPDDRDEGTAGVFSYIVINVVEDKEALRDMCISSLHTQNAKKII